MTKCFSFTVISSVDNLPEIVNQATSQSSQATSAETTKKQGPIKQTSPAPETEIPAVETKEEQGKSEPISVVAPVPTATELLRSIEKISKELPTVLETISESKEASSAIQAQAKLTQSIASCLRTNHPESKMKDINLNNKTTG